MNTTWRINHRPSWRNKNPLNKRWLIEQQARYYRDQQFDRLRHHAMNNYLDNDEHAALRQLALLKSEDRIDELCMPEWAAHAFKWPFNKE